MEPIFNPRNRYRVTHTWYVSAFNSADAIEEARKCYISETVVVMMPTILEPLDTLDTPGGPCLEPTHKHVSE